jgi:hypothetical protein
MRQSLRFFVPFTLSIVAEFFLVSYGNKFEVSITPVAEAQTTCDTGVSDAPCRSANKRIIIVNGAVTGNPAPNGEYKSLLHVFKNVIEPGDTVQIKNGSYQCTECTEQNGYWLRRGGTRELPVTIMNYPGNTPIIKTTMTIYRPWIIIEGLTFTVDCSRCTGLAMYGSGHFLQLARNITVRKNNFVNGGDSGIYTAGVGDVLYEDNIFRRNGLGPADCHGYGLGNPNDPHEQGLRYGHCHGMYLSNSDGNTTLKTPSGELVRNDNLTIRRNKFLMNTGFGFTSRADAVCVYPSTAANPCSWGRRNSNWLIENNLFVNQSLNIGFIDLNDSIIRNNTIVTLTWAQPNYADITCFYSNHNYNNIIANNVCYHNVDRVTWNSAVYHSWGADSTVGNTYRKNAWFARQANYWFWGGDKLQDFLGQWKSKSGDTATIMMPLTAMNGSEAGWVNPQPAGTAISAIDGDFHLLPSSPLRDAGDPAHCSPTDIEGKARTDGKCDIGAYEYGATTEGGTTPTPTPTPTPSTSSGPTSTPTPTAGQCTVYSPSSGVPQGFASPYNVVNNPNQNMMNISCLANKTQTISLGNGSQLTYIYKLGYALRNGAWQQVNYTGSSLLYNNWYAANATGSLNLTSTELSQGIYILSYQCQWTGTQWKCGCITSACNANTTPKSGGMWQIQFLKQ